MRRGIRRRKDVGNTVKLEGITSEGAIAFELRVSPDVFRAEWIGELERLLDWIDPPLRLVSSAEEEPMPPLPQPPLHPLPAAAPRTPLGLVRSETRRDLA